MNKCPLDLAINQNLTTLEEAFKIIQKADLKYQECSFENYIEKVKNDMVEIISKKGYTICNKTFCILNKKEE
jgi:hypothetical protein